MVGKQWCANVPIWHKELPQRAEHQSIPKSIRAAPQTCRETGSCRRRRDVARFLRETKKPGFFWTSCTRKQLWERRCRSPRSWCLEKRCCSASSLLPPPPLPKLSTSLSLIHVEIPIEHLSKSPTLDFLGLSQLFQRTEGTFSEHICPLKARAVKSTGTKSWLHHKENAFSKSKIRWSHCETARMSRKCPPLDLEPDLRKDDWSSAHHLCCIRLATTTASFGKMDDRFQKALITCTEGFVPF